MYYAIVSFGGAVAGEKVHESIESAKETLTTAERDTMGGGGNWTDPQVLARARINEYETREAAKNADISDTTDNSRGQRTPGFVRTVFIRS